MTLAKIAQMTGLSKATVSRALNHSPLVREETASRVREAVVRIGYKPPKRPRGHRRRANLSLNNTRRNRIALVTLGGHSHDWPASSVMGNFVSGLMAAGRDYEMNVVLEQVTCRADIVRLIGRDTVGGVILLADSAVMRDTIWHEPIEQMAQRMPLVWTMGSHACDWRVDHVLPDNMAIGRLAATYLHGRGCRRLVVLTSSPDWLFIRQRVNAFISAAYDAGLSTRAYLVSPDARIGAVYAGDVRVFGSLQEAAAALTGEGYKPDGLFCPRDYELSQLDPFLDTARAGAGRGLAVIGCDHDVRSLERMSTCPATIDINTRKVARVALRLLRSKMRKRSDLPVTVHVPPTLIEPNASDVISPVVARGAI